jgi:hypothetical protein
MSKSYRIRTKVGVDTSLKVLIEQEFEHLEILSLKILQSDIYTRQCADYGVIVGRVSVNNGFGLPNAKVSIFIPLDSIDQNNPIISELYPYKTLLDNNDDGYRYNLLPYKKSYSAHVPTGTFFTRNDVLTNPTLIEVYDKYYKYNATTNESGDFMIFGVPVGSHTIVMDVDLSDIGEFSLSPQDLIRMGLATEAQVAGTNFKSSNNLRELPQIINLTKSIEVEPLWGQPEICNLGITRTDFDLSSEAKIDIRPTSVFMGSIISGPNSSALSTGCRPPNTSGHLCNLTVGPGDILAIRQTILQDSNGLPILENFSLESGGKVIDENGTWMIDVPMNLDYYTTNEFGEQVLSNDPEVGIPTKGKYRFKVKWAQSPSLSETTRRGYFLIPNIKEYDSPNLDESYAFSVDWNDYAFSGDSNFNRIIQEAIDCEDRFYLMQYNKVYTVSQFISGRKQGNGIERYIGIKNILDDTCSGLNNRFPTNDGNFRFDILYIIFMFFSIILTPVFFALILVMHILYFVVWILRTILLPVLAIYYFIIGVQTCIGATAVGFGVTFSIGIFLAGLAYIALSLFIGLVVIMLFKINLSGIKVPILTYPDCDLCSCSPDSSTNENIGGGVNAPSSTNDSNKAVPCPSIVSKNNITSITLTPGILQLFGPQTFIVPVRNPNNPTGYPAARASVYNQNLTGNLYDFQYASNNIGAPFMSFVKTDDQGANDRWIYTTSIPMADMVNLFNVKAKYFNSSTTNPGGGVNRITVNFQPGQTSNFHYDNTTVIVCNKETLQSLIPGQLISFQDPTHSKDINLTSGIINKYGNNAITGITSTGLTTIQIYYANRNGSGNVTTPVTYQVNITADTANNFHKFPTDVEYFQVITGMTYSQYTGQCSTQLGFDSLNSRYLSNTVLMGQSSYVGPLNPQDNVFFRPIQLVEDHLNLCVLILNRGVDPYTPKVPISYGLGRLFGRNLESDRTVTGFYHMNIPIQGKFLNISHLSFNYPSITITSGSTSITAGSNIGVDSYSNTNQRLYFNSFSYVPQVLTITGQLTGYTAGQPFTYIGVINSGYSGFNSNLVSYYSHMDRTAINWRANCGGVNVNNVTTINGNVATESPSLGLRVSAQNKFGWEIFSSTTTVPFIGSASENYLNSAVRYVPNTGRNQGYFLNEIVEGGSLMYTNINLANAGGNTQADGPSPDLQSNFNYVLDVSDSNNNNSGFYISSNYFSRIYNTTGNTLNFTLGSNNNQIVMRGDRLPTSTNVQEYCCNGMVLQKNLDFQIFLIPEEGVLDVSSSPGSTGSASSGDLEYTYEDLAGSTGITKVFDSFTCNGSVNLECYDCQNSTILIRPRGNPCQEYLGETIFEFGCYRFITTIFLSLLRDWELMFEWIARNMVMLGACRNVFSHRFINNWVNGVLYAFPFKNEIVGYTSPNSVTPNQPIPKFCESTLRYYGQTKNFYYRATPYNPTTNQFREISTGNMGFPTTIMDLGPRANYLQELVMSDEYDGYVVNRLDSSSFGTVDDILNLFIVSRFMDNNFLTNLLGSLNILAYFSNSRPSRGTGGTKLMIDADYAQLISINSELGVAPFLSSNYPDNPPGQQNPIFFDCSNVLGIFFSSDTQLRDYITPKRTVINPAGTSVNNCTFNNFPVYSQVVPLSQWKIETNPTSFSGNDSIFGRQFNNWDFTVSGSSIHSNRYQSLDRLQQSSRYFRTDGSSQTQYQKGYIYAVKTVTTSTGAVSVQLSASPLDWDPNATPAASNQLVTVGAPFHFYFGLRRGASAFDRFRKKWINTSNIVD